MAGDRESLGAALVDLVLPQVCAGCGRPRALLCRSCAALLTVPRPAEPRRFPSGFPPTVAAGAYAGEVRAAVLAFKERGRAELAGPLGAALALAVGAVLRGALREPLRRRGPVLLVPVPSTPEGRRARGRDHVRELTGVAVAELRAVGLSAREARLLGRHGRVRDSAGLSVGERRANLAGSFTARPTAAGPLLVLVDDVVTSGATLTAAAAALSGESLGIGPPVLAAVVATTPRSGTRSRSGDRFGAGSEPSRRPPDRLSGRRGRD